MKKIAVIVLFLSVAFGLFFLKKNFNIQSKNKTADNYILTWEYSPKTITLKTPVEFIFDLKDKKNNPVKNAKIDIEANMNHSGMVPVFTEAIYISNSTYKTRLTLTMLGEWILFLTIKLPDGELIKREVSFSTN